MYRSSWRDWLWESDWPKNSPKAQALRICFGLKCTQPASEQHEIGSYQIPLEAKDTDRCLFWGGLHKVPLKMPLAIIQLFNLFSNRSSTAHALKHHQLTVSLNIHTSNIYTVYAYILYISTYILKIYIAFPHFTVSLFCKKTPAVPMAKPWSSLRFLSRSLEGNMAQPVSRSPVVWTWMSTDALKNTHICIYIVQSIGNIVCIYR